MTPFLVLKCRLEDALSYLEDNPDIEHFLDLKAAEKLFAPFLSLLEDAEENQQLHESESESEDEDEEEEG